MTTLNNVQEFISAEFDQSGSVISSASNEYSRRTKLINLAERNWREFGNGKWRVLRTEASLSLTISQSYVTLPADYILGREDLPQHNTVLEIGTSTYIKVNPNEVYEFDSNDNVFWISGNEFDGFRIEFPGAATAATTFTFPYFSKYTAVAQDGTDKEFLTLPTDTTKIPDPTYLSDFALGRLFRGDEEITKGGMYTNEAVVSKLVVMSGQNAITNGLTIRNVNDDISYEPIGGNNDL